MTDFGTAIQTETIGLQVTPSMAHLNTPPPHVPRPAPNVFVTSHYHCIVLYLAAQQVDAPPFSSYPSKFPTQVRLVTLGALHHKRFRERNHLGRQHASPGHRELSHCHHLCRTHNICRWARGQSRKFGFVRWLQRRTQGQRMPSLFISLRHLQRHRRLREDAHPVPRCCISCRGHRKNAASLD